MFELVDDIIKLGKWAYKKIPSGNTCDGCPLLEGDDGGRGGNAYWHCGIRPAYSLIHESTLHVFKDKNCPVEKK